MSDPTDEPLLTDPDRRRLAAIVTERNPLTRADLVRDYYRDPDRMGRTPRLIMVGHLALLAGSLAGLAQTLIDPATDAGLTDDDRARLAAIAAEADRNPAAMAVLIGEYWHDGDRAARTSRAPLYLHMGALMRVLNDHAGAFADRVVDRLAGRLAAGAGGDPDADAETLDPPTLERLAAELTAAADRGRVLALQIHPISAFQLAGLVQLALRHPDVSPDLRETGTRVVAGIRAYFAAAPTVRAVIDLADDAAGGTVQ